MKAVIAFFLSLFHVPNLDILHPSASSAAQAAAGDDKMTVVATVVGVIFTGIVLYLVFIDRKVGRIEKQMQASKG